MIAFRVNPKKLWSIQTRVASFCAAEVQLKDFAQRAFVAYIKSVFLMKDKKVFDVSKLDTDAYARYVSNFYASSLYNRLILRPIYRLPKPDSRRTSISVTSGIGVLYIGPGPSRY